MNPIRIVIIDDDQGIRFLMKEILQLEEAMEVCGEAQNLAQAKETLLKYRPDIAILDISIEGEQGGLDFMESSLSLNLPTQFIIFSAHDESTFASKSLAKGAKGYVCKDKAVQCLGLAIRDVHSGKTFVSISK